MPKSPGRTAKIWKVSLFARAISWQGIEKKKNITFVFFGRLGEMHALRAHVESVMRLKRMDSHVVRSAQSV